MARVQRSRYTRFGEYWFYRSIGSITIEKMKTAKNNYSVKYIHVCHTSLCYSADIVVRASAAKSFWNEIYFVFTYLKLIIKSCRWEKHRNSNDRKCPTDLHLHQHGGWNTLLCRRWKTPNNIKTIYQFKLNKYAKIKKKKFGHQLNKIKKKKYYDR